MSRLMHRTLRDQPDTAGSGEGTRLRLADGREVIDGSGGCAAALEVQRIMAEEDLVARCARMGAVLERLLTERFGNHRHVGDIRGRGLFRGLEFVADRAGRTPFDPALRLHERIKDAALDRGLAVYPSGGTLDGVRGDHLIVAPPYIVTPADLGTIVERLGAAVDAAIDAALATL